REARDPEQDDPREEQARELALREQEVGPEEREQAQRAEHEGDEERVDGEDARVQRRQALDLPVPGEHAPEDRVEEREHDEAGAGRAQEEREAQRGLSSTSAMTQGVMRASHATPSS